MPSPREALQTFSAVVLTGGSSGIGKSFIDLAAKLQPGLQICNLSRSKPLIPSAQLNLCHIACDISRPDSVEAAAREVEAFLGRDVPAGRMLLINNSGFGSYGLFPEPNLAHQLEMLDVNVRGVVHLTGCLLPILRQRGGVVMNIASTAAFQPTPSMAVYAASKTFVLNWTIALNEEWRGTPLRAMAVCPGPTATQFFRRAGLAPRTRPDPMSMSADAVARESLRGLAAGRSIVVPGWKNRVTSRLAGFVSRPMAAWVAGKVVGRYRLRRVAR